MAEPVGDLVVDLSLDAARFDEQMARVRRHFSGTESDAKKTAAVVEQSLSRQALAAQKAGISVGQYKAAMRMLPAQFTDVATQLAGGQSPWLILLQQGGQVKDSFGGMIPMFRGLAGAITLPMVGATSLAVATGALAYAWYQGNSTLSDFNKTLVLSGNQAGLTADRMLVLSRAGQAAGLTFNQTSESLSALVKAGVSGEAQIASISQSVARFSSASGVEVDKVAEAFGKLTTDPTSGLTAMARQFHNVSAEQIAYVAQLQRSGDEAGALQAANEAATKGFDDQTRRLKENMGTLETWADRTARAFKSMWDAVLDIGRPDTAQEMLIKAEAAYKKADDIWNLRKDDYFVNDEARARYWRMLPAQFTDVATQLAGGQSPWLILLQQGGQVKDSFGGMIPMFRGLAGAITLPMVGATSLAVATGALAYAWYQGNSTLSDFNKTLVLSGNQAGLTADRMLVLSRAGQAAGLTFNQTSESLSALVKAGVSGEAQIASISQSVARFSSASGVEVDKVAEAFGKLTTDPTSGLTAMARQFHNVSAEQIAYVAQLQRSGDEAGALQAANEAATKGFDDQTRRLKENMGTLETWADRTARAFKSMWDAVLDIGRPDTAQEMLIKAEAAYKKADDIWNLRKDDYFVNDEARARYW
ncbi:tail component, partial [Bacillus thuringiensis Sbt003]